MLGAFRQLRREDPLAAFSFGTSALLGLAFLVFGLIALVVQREHVAFERAHRLCGSGAPPGVTGWTLRQTGDTRFVCIYDRNGGRTGETRLIERNR